MDQLTQSSYSAIINLAHNAVSVKREQQPDETLPRPDVGFVDVDSDRVRPLEPPQELGQDVDPLLLPATCQTWNTVLPDFTSPPEPRHIKHEVLDDIEREPPEMQFCPTTSRGTLNDGQGDVDQLQLSSLPESHCLKPEVRFYVKQEHLSLQSCSVEASEVCTTQLQTNIGSFSSSAESSRKLSSSVIQEHSCTECDAVFASPDNLVDHVKTHSTKNVRVWDQGGEQAISGQPQSVYSEEEVYACDLCAARFTRGSELALHKQSHSVVTPIACDTHEARFGVSSNVTQLVAKHYACDICEARFTQSSNLTRHKRSHSGVKSYACDICEARFAESSNLTKHKRTHSGVKSYACEICEARFSQNWILTKHKRTHSGLKAYACDICEARFTEMSALSNHMRTHSGSKPYGCDICNARFTHSSTLTKHKRTHSGVKAYACNICEARFTESFSLTKHKRTHSGEKPYGCDICNARFAESSSLSKHKRTHSGIKAYACDLCEGRFTHSSSLTKHKRTHSGAKP